MLAADGTIPTASDGSTPSAESVPKNVLDDVNEQMAELMAGVDRLSAKMQQKADSRSNNGAQRAVEVDDLRRFMLQAQQDLAARAGQPMDLAALPATFNDKIVIVTECDELCLSGDVDRTLLGDAQAAAAAESTSARTAALQALRLSLDDASASLAAAGVCMRPEFVDFAEACAVKRVRLCILSRGLKPLIRLLLREQGLGHVEVLAHDMMVDPKSCEWKVSLNADGWKTEALRRALHSSKAPPQAIVHIGRCACDLPVATGGKVSCLIAPVGSELSRLAHASKVKHLEFGGWDALAALIMGTGSVNAVAVADGTDLADLTEIDP